MSSIYRSLKVRNIRAKLKKHIASISIIIAGLFLMVPSLAMAVSPTSTLPFVDPNPQPNNQFGYAVSLSEDGTVAVVTANYQTDSNGNTQAGAAYVFVNSNGAWTEATQLVPTTSAVGYDFGTSADITSDGTKIIVGASNPQGSNNGLPGAAYIYNVPSGFSSSSLGWASLNTNGNITQDNPSADLQETNPQLNDFFGTSVALSNNGSTAVVGAKNSNSPGSAYIFNEPSGVWSGNPVQSTLITSKSPKAGDQFGGAVAVSNDGSTVVVGAPSQGISAQGNVNIYNVPSGGWPTQSFDNSSSAQLYASDTAYYNGENNLFGYDLSLSSDGNTLIVGSPGFTTSTYPTNDGDAYVFNNSSTGWISTELSNPNPSTISFYGDAVAIANDGTSVLVGAPGQTVSSQSENGEAYQYVLGSTGIWGTNVPLLPSSSIANQNFGEAVSIVNNPAEGNIFIGAPGLTGSGSTSSNSSPAIKSMATTNTSTTSSSSAGKVYLIDTNKPTISTITSSTNGSGKLLTINGGHLDPTDGQGNVNTAVYFGSKLASINSISETQIVVNIPSGTATTVKVTTPNGSAITSLTGVPSITSFSPTSIGEGTKVTIKGSSLGSGTASLNGTPLNVLSSAAGSIVVMMPHNAVSGTLSVTIPNGDSTNSQIVILPPQISTIPTSATPGNKISLSGNYLGGVTTVQFGSNGPTQAVLTATSTKVTVVVPVNAPVGEQYLTVTSANGQSTSSTEINIK